MPRKQSNQTKNKPAKEKKKQSGSINMRGSVSMDRRESVTQYESSAPQSDNSATQSEADTVFGLPYTVSIEDYIAEGMGLAKDDFDLEARISRERLLLDLQQTHSQIKMFEEAKKFEEDMLSLGIISNSPSNWLLGEVLNTQIIQIPLTTRACQTDWKWLTMAVRWKHARFIKPTVKKEAPKTVIEIEKKASIATDIFVLSPVVAVDQTSQGLSRPPSRENAAIFCATETQKRRSLVDKCIDTHDLNFDPYDAHMVYTRVEKDDVMFSTARTSAVIQKWQKKTKRKLLLSPTPSFSRRPGSPKLSSSKSVTSTASQLLLSTSPSLPQHPPRQSVRPLKCKLETAAAKEKIIRRDDTIVGRDHYDSIEVYQVPDMYRDRTSLTWNQDEASEDKNEASSDQTSLNDTGSEKGSTRGRGSKVMRGVTRKSSKSFSDRKLGSQSVPELPLTQQHSVAFRETLEYGPIFDTEIKSDKSPEPLPQPATEYAAAEQQDLNSESTQQRGEHSAQ